MISGDIVKCTPYVLERRMIWIFAGHTGHFVGFVILRLKQLVHFSEILIDLYVFWHMGKRLLCCFVWTDFNKKNTALESGSESELLLGKRPNDNHSPAPVIREVSPYIALAREVNLATVFWTLSSRKERICKRIPRCLVRQLSTCNIVN